MRPSFVLPTLLLLVAACDQIPGLGPSSPPPAASAAVAVPAAVTRPVPTRSDAVLAARRCGDTLGIAARCNLMRDDHDFAVLRYSVLQGLGQQYDKAIDAKELTDMVDLATLDRMTTIGSCTMTPADLTRVAASVRSSIAGCAGP
jgi:hypothetical protein